MANPAQLDLLKHGALTWNLWRTSHQSSIIDLSSANLSGVDLYGIDLHEANLYKVNFTGSNLNKANLIKANLANTILHNTYLVGAYLNDASLLQAILIDANLTNAKIRGANFSDANLNHASFRGADLRGSSLVRANLTDADLTDADLGRTKLHGADLCGSTLIRANLINADLRGSSLVRANLTHANLHKANLTDANFYGVILREADLIGLNLSVVQRRQVEDSMSSGINYRENQAMEQASKLYEASNSANEQPESPPSEKIEWNDAQPSNASKPNKISSSKNVFFTAYHPTIGKVKTWHTLLVYAHVSSALTKVRKDAERFDDQIKAPKKTTLLSSTQIARGTQLTIVPSCEGVIFNPESISFKWLEDFHRADFRFQADKSLLDDAAKGQITIYVGPLIVGSLKFAMLFNNKESKPAENEEHGKAYGKDDVFISYSRKDTEVARAFKNVLEGTGLDVFLDVDDIRSGQLWEDELKRRIERAKIFEIFWSANYSQSENCKQEWEYALKQNKDEGYIRPVFWQKPLTPNPPEELNKFNFKYVELKV